MVYPTETPPRLVVADGAVFPGTVNSSQDPGCRVRRAARLPVRLRRASGYRSSPTTFRPDPRAGLFCHYNLQPKIP